MKLLTALLAKSLTLCLQVGTLRQALHIKAADLSKQAGTDIHSRLLYAVAKVTHLSDVVLLAYFGHCKLLLSRVKALWRRTAYILLFLQTPAPSALARASHLC